MDCIYLDNNATTPLDPRVFEGLEPYCKEFFGNPSSKHDYGYKAHAAVLKGRKRVADLIGTKALNILFTSGATESNNMVVLGKVMKYLPFFNPDIDKDSKIHIITSCVEHKCILETCKRAEQWGAEVTYLPVNQHGQIEIADLEKAIRPHTKLVSLIFANNEIGSINPIKEIGEMCHAHGITFHTDAAQAVGKVDIDVEEMHIDLLSMSGHKIYGPKGIGALYVREGLDFTPMTLGGGQEQGFRSGTHNVAGIVGLGLACEVAALDKEKDDKNLSEMRQWLCREILSNIPGSRLNGHPKERLHGNLSISFEGLSAKMFSKELRDIAFSTSSACSSGAPKPSYVLKAIGLSDELAMSTIRFGLGRFTTWEEVKFAAEKVINLAKQKSN